MIKWPKKSWDQHVKKIEENPELLQQGLIKVNQPSQQEGNLKYQATMYMPTRLESIRQTRATRAANQQTLEVRRASTGIYLKFPNISKTSVKRPSVVHHLACSLNLGAQVKVKIGLILQQVMQGQDGRKANFSELDGVRIQLQFKDTSNATPQETVACPEVLQCLKEMPLHQQRKRDWVTLHTLHLTWVQ